MLCTVLRQELLTYGLNSLRLFAGGVSWALLTQLTSMGVATGILLGICIGLPLTAQALATRTTSSPARDPALTDLQAFADTLGAKHNLPDVRVVRTDELRGVRHLNIGAPDVIHVPRATNPEAATPRAKAVVAHECAHVKYYDSVSHRLRQVSLMLLVGLCVFDWLTTGGVLNGVLACLGTVGGPSLIHYYRHRAEYRADAFAAANAPTAAVSRRLRSHIGSPYTHSLLTLWPYVLEYPPRRARLDRLHTNHPHEFTDGSETSS